MAVGSTNPVLRQKTFLWAGVAPLDQSQLSSIQGGYALGSADGATAVATSALLLPIPDWSTAALASPWLIDQASFPGLAAAMGGPSVPITAPINLLGSALTIDPATNTAILALLAEAQSVASQTLLLGLGQLASAPSVAWSTLLPDEQIQRLLLSNAATGSSLITVGTSQAGQGAISTRYPLQQTGPALQGALRTYLAGPSDIQSKAADGALLSATSNGPALVEVGLASAPTTIGLVPSGGTDVLVSALDRDGKLLWERLFGNTSTEQQPRLAVGADGAIVVAATLQGSLGLNPAGGGLDIGLASYSPGGDLQWRRLLGDAGNQQITDLTVAPDGTILVLGLTSGSPGTSASPKGLYGQAAKGNGSDVDAFLTAYSPQGDRLWTYQFGSPGEDLALAMDWMPTGVGSTTNTLAVVGSQATSADPNAPKAWVELLELPSTATVADSFIPPRPPTLDWGTNAVDPTLGVPLALIRRAPGTTAQLLLQGTSEPGSTVQVRTSLSSAATTATADATTGRWTLALDLPQLTASQLGQGFVLLEARDALGLVSDTTAVPVLFTGTGLPGELPQLLAIDPDGASGTQPAALLQRQITALGDGPLTLAGQRLLVDYSGTLANGSTFDSSLNQGRRPFDLTLGAGRVITGWDQGLQGLPLGSQVRLVIPPSLAYGDRAAGTIPAGSTLTFTVDLRADLSIPELFLRDVVWPQFFDANTSYTNTNTSLLKNHGQDLLGLALTFGPGDGTDSADTINLAPVSGFPTSYPLLAMGGAASDTLAASGQQSSLLFGEAGNDQLRSTEALYAFLDGGSGNDRLESKALVSWLRGGSGTDTVAIPTGDWRLQRSGTVAGDPWRELGLFDANGQLLQLLELQGIEQIVLTGTAAKASDLLGLLSGLGNEVVDAAALTAIIGSVSDLKNVYAAASAGRITGLANATPTVDPGAAAAADLLELDAKTTVTVNASAVTELTGTTAAIKQAITTSTITKAPAVAVTIGDPANTPLLAVDLAAIGGATNGAVTVSNAVAISGTAAEATAALVTDATKVLASTANVTLTGTATVTQANAIDAATSGVITATISNTSITDLAALTGTANAYSVTVTDASVDAAALNTLDAKTTLTVNATGVQTLTGTTAAIKQAITTSTITKAPAVAVTIGDPANTPLLAADLAAIGGATTAPVTVTNAVAISGTTADATAALVTADTKVLASTANVTVTGTATVTQANAIAAATSGVITATISDGTITALANLTGTANAYSVSVTDTSVDAAALNALDAKTTVTVNANGVKTLTGTTTAIKQAITTSTITKAPAVAVTIGDPANTLLQAADLAVIGGATTAPVTVTNAVAISGTAAEATAALVTDATKVLASTANVTVTGTATVTQANAIDAATSGVITATISNTSITDLAALTGTANAYSVTVTDASVDAAALNTLDAKTTLTVNATGVQTLTGSASERNQAFQAPGLSLSLADDQAPLLRQVITTAGSYGPNRTISLTLSFDEPVHWQGKSPGDVPVLQLSNGLTAAWVAPAPGSAGGAREQRFDLLTGQRPPTVSQLQVLGLAGLGQFSDAAGNALAAPQADTWKLPQTVSISPWNLDVDGDGVVTPLGDGLMIIRKLFGSAFQGEALTAKAISPNATRNTSEIHAYIQQGIDQGLLDVDRDGHTTPLGDGLMVIRQLFGTAFSGTALINKAIGETSSLIPQGQTLTSLDAAGLSALAIQVRQQITSLLP